ncbi:MAG TPA: DciA family protein [Gallionella sp.]|nr:DciA family protein [Gallionella sp.]
MAQRFKSLLSGNQELRPLLAKAQALSALHRHFMGVAPPHLAQSSQVLGLQSGMLSIAVANAAIAAKLRQLVPELVVMLQNRGCEVSGIRVKVQVSFNLSQPVSPPRKLGKTARDTLNEFNQTLGDSPLKLTLKKMIETKE